jgi:hypothetical protein
MVRLVFFFLSLFPPIGFVKTLEVSQPASEFSCCPWQPAVWSERVGDVLGPPDGQVKTKEVALSLLVSALLGRSGSGLNGAAHSKSLTLDECALAAS